jgi:hypothetical protein
MFKALLKFFVRLKFFCTSRKAASREVERTLATYLDIASDFPVGVGKKPYRVPRMAGVDEEMRDWSFFMLLEHNTIVNRSISKIVQCLALRYPLSGDALLDPARDVMPSTSPGEEQIALFAESVRRHLEMVEQLPPFRGGPTATHPLFGELTAHGWHCMFSFHLAIHIGQAKSLLKQAGQ